MPALRRKVAVMHQQLAGLQAPVPALPLTLHFTHHDQYIAHAMQMRGARQVGHGPQLAAMAFLDWRLMLIVLALLPAVLVIVFLYQRWSAPAVTRARALRSEINGQIAESIGGMSVLQANNAEKRFGARFTGINQEHYTARMQELRANAWLLRPALDMLNIVLLAVVIALWFEAQQDRAG